MSPTPRVQTAGPASLRRLTRVGADGCVLSVYLNLDPSEFATAPARETQINSALNQALAEIERLDGDAKKDLRVALDEVRSFLEDTNDWATDAHGLAVFSSPEADLFEVVKLPSPVETAAVVQPGPYLLPLTEVTTDGRWCVALVNRRGARIFLGTPAKLREVDDVDDEVPGGHQQGGWSQARYQRAIEEDVDDHLDRTGERLIALRRLGRYDRLVIGATEELWPRITGKLAPEIGEDLCTRIDVDTQKNIGVHEVQEALARVAEEQDARNEAELLDRLRQELGTNARGVAGLAPVLACLNEARVETLLVAPAFEAPGRWCPSCRWLGESGEECPVDGTPLQESANIVEQAVERCGDLSAGFRVVKTENALTDFGDIAAILRF